MTDPDVTWLLLDYGGVVCRAQPEETRDTLVRLAGTDADSFWAAFWANRGPYDAGALSVLEYWHTVASALGVEWSDDRCLEMAELDIKGWLRPNSDTLRVMADAKANGTRLGLLSNAPAELATALRGTDWMNPFDELIFSCDLGTIKPDYDCYLAALAILRARPDEVLFVDDRQANVDSARTLGMRARLFGT